MSWKGGGAEPVLTPREQEVLGLVARGLSAKEIAGAIGIAPRTVEGHIDTVRLKVRARNKTHMVTQAVLAGVLKLDPDNLNGGKLADQPDVTALPTDIATH